MVEILLVRQQEVGYLQVDSAVAAQRAGFRMRNRIAAILLVRQQEVGYSQVDSAVVAQRAGFRMRIGIAEDRRWLGVAH